MRIFFDVKFVNLKKKSCVNKNGEIRIASQIQLKYEYSRISESFEKSRTRKIF